MILNNQKFLYLIRLRFDFFNYDYLCFFKSNNHDLRNFCDKYSLNFLNIQSSYLKKIFDSDKPFLSSNQSLIYFNDFNKFSNLLENFSLDNVNIFSWTGFFINNKFIKKINNYYLFYNNNFKIFIFTIYLNINSFKIMVYALISKFVNIFKLIYINLIKKN